MVGAGLVVLGDPGRHLLRVPPRDQRVDQPVASRAGQVVLGEAQPQPVAGVVGQGQVPGEHAAGDAPRLVRVRLQDHRLLGREQRLRPEDLPSPVRVLGCDQVRVRAGGAVPGQLQHPRPESGQHPVVHRHRRIRGVQLVQVADQLLVRALVPLARHRLHRRLVPRPDTQQDPVRMGPPDLGEGRGRRGGRLEPDVDDAGRDHHPGGGGQQVGDQLEVTRRRADPQRAVAQLVQLCGGLDRRPIGQQPRGRPDTDPANIHCHGAPPHAHPASDHHPTARPAGPQVASEQSLPGAEKFPYRMASTKY